MKVTVAAVVICALVVPAQAVQYTVRDLGPGTAYAINNNGQAVGGDSLWQNGMRYGIPMAANAINDRGQVAGWAYTHDGCDAFVWQNGPPYSYIGHLGTLGGPYSAANAINNNLQVVGWATTAGGGREAFLWQDAMQDLGPGEAFDINDAGVAAGRSETIPLHFRAALWHDGAVEDLGPGTAYGINETGQVVGYTTGTGRHRAALWESGVTVDLGTLTGYLSSEANGINDGGQVVGWSLTDTGGGWAYGRAFLWQEGVMYDLGTLPGYAYSAATAINNGGQVVGYSFNGPGDHHAVLWDPVVPEPTCLLALLCGLAGASAFRRRSKRADSR